MAWKAEDQNEFLVWIGAKIENLTPCTHRTSDSIDIDDGTLSSPTLQELSVTQTLGMRLWTSSKYPLADVKTSKNNNKISSIFCFGYLVNIFRLYTQALTPTRMYYNILLAHTGTTWPAWTTWLIDDEVMTAFSSSFSLITSPKWEIACQPKSIEGSILSLDGMTIRKQEDKLIAIAAQFARNVLLIWHSLITGTDRVLVTITSHTQFIISTLNNNNNLLSLQSTLAL